MSGDSTKLFFFIGFLSKRTSYLSSISSFFCYSSTFSSILLVGLTHLFYLLLTPIDLKAKRDNYAWESSPLNLPSFDTILGVIRTPFYFLRSSCSEAFILVSKALIFFSLSFRKECVTTLPFLSVEFFIYYSMFLKDVLYFWQYVSCYWSNYSFDKVDNFLIIYFWSRSLAW